MVAQETTITIFVGGVLTNGITVTSNPVPATASYTPGTVTLLLSVLLLNGNVAPSFVVNVNALLDTYFYYGTPAFPMASGLITPYPSNAIYNAATEFTAIPVAPSATSASTTMLFPPTGYEAFTSTTHVLTLPSTPADALYTIQVGDTVNVTMNDFVYLSRPTVMDTYSPILTSDTVKTLWVADVNTTTQLQTYIRYPGRYPLNFAWFHQTQDYYLTDPATTNIIDMFIITVGYYEALQQWLSGQTNVQPTPPTSLDLRTSYGTELQAAMISDTVVLHSGTFQLLFGANADPTLQASFAVVRPNTNVTLTDNQVQNAIVSIIQDFFDPNYWEFGETFEFQELAAVVLNQLVSEISTIVIVPTFAANQFGDLFEITPGENQLFLPDISTSNINIVTTLSPQVLRQAGF